MTNTKNKSVKDAPTTGSDARKMDGTSKTSTQLRASPGVPGNRKGTFIILDI